MTDEEKLITICDDRFEIISKAKKHIIEATNIEMSPKEMEVLDNFLFRCWQMDWLKNDYKALEIENAELKEQLKNNPYVIQLQNEKAEMAEDFAKQIEKMKCCGNCKWYRLENGGETFCDCAGDCIGFDKWELEE